MIIVEPLNEKNIDEAVALASSVFSDDAGYEYAPAKVFPMSLDLKWRESFWGKGELGYFVMLDPDTKKVIGTTGLYRLPNDPPELVWVGWYCVAPEERGKGLGEALLTWTIDKARKAGYLRLKLFTSNDPALSFAQSLYDKSDFKLVGEEQKPGDKYKTLYREKEL